MSVQDKDKKILPYEIIILDDIHNNPNMEIDYMITYHRRVVFPKREDEFINYIKNIVYNSNPTITKFNHHENTVNVYPAVQ